MPFTFLRVLALILLLAQLFGCGGAGGAAPFAAPQTMVADREAVDPPVPKNSAAEQTVKPALLRLEDIHPGGAYASEENLYKLRVVGQYLHGEGIPFHISLIPRSVDPPQNYDVKITDKTGYAKKFLETIIYLQSMGGIVGAHGYTHQSGNTASGIGFEFHNPMHNPSVPDRYSYGADRIDRAMELFLGAGIYPAYWETPHYTASLAQYRAFEEQSGLLYENYWAKPIPHQQMYDLSRSYRGYVTVPTPLGHVEREGDLERIVKILDRPDFTDLASFFYHPFKEFKYIQVTYDGQGRPSHVYDSGSPLHQLVGAFKARGYTFDTIYSVVRFVPAQGLIPLDYEPGDEVLAGNFGPGNGKMLLIWGKAGDKGRIYGYSAPWYSPRKGKAFVDKGLWAEARFPIQNFGKNTPLVVDFSGDGRDDLAFFPFKGGVPYLLENKGNGFAETPSDFGLAVPEVLNARQFTGDFDGNGLEDLAIYDRQQGRVGLINSTPRGFGPLYWQQVDFLQGNNIVPLAGDFNGDLTSDVAVLDTDSGQWWVLLGSQGTLDVTGPWLSRWGSGGEWQPFAGDVNGDRKCDLVMYNKSGLWQIALSSGRDFSYVGEFGPWGAGRECVPLVEDISGDGRADLIVIDSDGQGAYRLDTAISVLGR